MIGKERLIDYLQSHVITFVDYLAILKKKYLNKVVAKIIRGKRWKEKEEKQVRKTMDVG
jgi:hypothetical protein